jgi:hypothetical protein
MGFKVRVTRDASGTFARMRSRTRRRIDIALLVLAVAIAGGAGAIGASAGDPERVAELWAGAQISNRGSARIAEVVDFDFGIQRRHGVYRDVPGLPADAEVVAHSDTAPDDVAVTPRSSLESRILVGDPDRKISGRHRYTIEYSLDSLLVNRRVAWNAVGSSWPVSVHHVEAHLVTPFRLEGARCFRGKEGSVKRCSVREVEPGHLVARIGRLESNEGVTVEATAAGSVVPAALPDRPSGAIEDPGTGVLPPLAVAAIAARAAAIPTSMVIRRAGRERVAVGGAAAAAWGGEGGADGEAYVMQDSDDLAALATVEFAPPDDLSPAQAGVLLTESVSPDHKTAWLVQAAIDGYVDIEQNGSEVTLVRRDRRDGRVAAILDQAFAGRDRLSLGKYDSSFAEAWTEVAGELSNWQRASGLWDAASDRKKTLVRVIGTLVGVAGLVFAGLAAWQANVRGPVWLVLVVASFGAIGALLVALGGVLAGGGAAALIRGWELRVRSTRGSALWLRVESFRRFLAESEGLHAEEAAKRGVLREYTAWAVAVGEVDRWSRAVQSAGAAVADPDAMRYAFLAPSLASATSSTSTAPSSSSGGGGGGVGSGGGGGGGGSW